jgi:hypothetical protein
MEEAQKGHPCYPGDQICYPPYPVLLHDTHPASGHMVRIRSLTYGPDDRSVDWSVRQPQQPREVPLSLVKKKVEALPAWPT